MALYGVGLNAEINNIVVQLKLHIAKAKGGITIRNLKQVFQQADKNQSGKLDYEEFELALNKFGFFLKKYQYQTIFKCFDQNKDNVIDFSEFVKILREPLTERRLKLVLKVFDTVDVNNNGVLTVDDIKPRFDVSKHPDVLKGKATPDYVLNEYLNNFETDKDGNVTKDEFIQYYEDLSMAIRSDSLFIETIQKHWGVTEDEESYVDEFEVKNVVKILRYKLIQMTNGISDEFLLKKIFNEFDYNKSGNLSLDELYAMTIKLEVPIHKKYLSALFKKFDRDGSGYIEFNEFLYFLTYDPYP